MESRRRFARNTFPFYASDSTKTSGCFGEKRFKRTEYPNEDLSFLRRSSSWPYSFFDGVYRNHITLSIDRTKHAHITSQKNERCVNRFSARVASLLSFTFFVSFSSVKPRCKWRSNSLGEDESFSQDNDGNHVNFQRKRCRGQKVWNGCDRWPCNCVRVSKNETKHRIYVLLLFSRESVETAHRNRKESFANQHWTLFGAYCIEGSIVLKQRKWRK